jgi:ABC-2 type transport system ATP-binding protein
MPHVLIHVRDVGKSFRAVRAVDGISFEVNQGAIFALLGPNGAGKSTLVRMMIGMLPPDQGRIDWFDRNGNPSSMNAAEIGYLPEDRGLYRCQKVGRILEYFGQLRGMSVAQSKSAAHEWATRLEVVQYMDSKLETLSKGNQQKVQVAAAVLHRPRIAFLDEPFSGLDPLNQEMMLGVIRSLQEQGTTVVLSAHQLELVERLADYVFLLAHGKHVLSGTVPELKTSKHSGYSLQIHFANSIPDDTVESWASYQGLENVERLSDKSVQLTLKQKSSAVEWVERASQMGEITDFRGGSLSLHEIYLRALHRGSKDEPSVGPIVMASK